MPYGNKPDVFGNTFNFKSLQGNVVLVVNIPYDCKLTDPLYDDLRYVHNELNKKGAFIILFFMSELFSGSNPKCDEKQIRKQKKMLSRLPFKIFKAFVCPFCICKHNSNGYILDVAGSICITSCPSGSYGVVDTDAQCTGCTPVSYTHLTLPTKA